MKKLFTFFVLGLTSHLLSGQVASDQVFTSSGTFVVPPGIYNDTITIEVLGAGGSGGGNGTGGGGGGGYARGKYHVSAGDTLHITIGMGGGGPILGSTYVDSLIGATGGANGISVSNPNIGGGGAGGTGVNGTEANYTGGGGGGGYYTYFGGGGGGAAGSSGNGNVGGNTIPWTGICLTPGGTGGISGGAPGGNGGKGAGFTDINCNVTDSAEDGFNYGGGGGGGNGNSGPAGNGAPGYCRISWFTCSVSTGVTLNGTTLTADNDTATAYQWIDCANGNPVAGQTGSSFTPAQTGNYAVIINEGAQCRDTSECITVTISTVGLDNSVSEELSVYPNPFTAKITVYNATGLEEYELLNAEGRVVWNGKQIGQQDFSTLRSGIYFLKVKNDKMPVFRLIKE